MRGAAYLYENGTQLPGIFRDVLTILYGNSRTEEDLHAVIRRSAGLKETWILARWASWESFSGDILAAVQDAGFAETEDGKWMLTSRAVPGKSLTVLRHPDEDKVIRVTFHAEQEEHIRETLAAARIKAGEFAFYLDGERNIHPVLAGACDRMEEITKILTRALRDPGEALARKGFVGGQSEWYRQWVRTAGWHSTDSARLAWNDGHPGKFVPVAASCGFRTVQRTMVRDKLMETRPAIRKDGKSGGTEYRWKRE